MLHGLQPLMLGVYMEKIQVSECWHTAEEPFVPHIEWFLTTFSFFDWLLSRLAFGRSKTSRNKDGNRSGPRKFLTGDQDVKQFSIITKKHITYNILRTSQSHFLLWFVLTKQFISPYSGCQSVFPEVYPAWLYVRAAVCHLTSLLAAAPHMLKEKKNALYIIGQIRGG